MFSVSCCGHGCDIHSIPCLVSRLLSHGEGLRFTKCKLFFKVVFDIDANKEFIVPILGDLKLIMKTFKRDLSNVPNLNQELINLITTVENGDVPKISLKWVKEDILIGITHEYKQEKYSFIQFYGEIKNSEVMDYVREYFTGSKQELDGEQSEDK